MGANHTSLLLAIFTIENGLLTALCPIKTNDTSQQRPRKATRCAVLYVAEDGAGRMPAARRSRPSIEYA